MFSKVSNMWDSVKAFQEGVTNTISGATRPDSDTGGTTEAPPAQPPVPGPGPDANPTPADAVPGSPSGSDATEGPDAPDPEDQQLVTPDREEPASKPGDGLTANGEKPNTATSPTQNAQAAVAQGMQEISEVSAKAFNTAKTFGTNFGSFLAGVGKAATEKVATTAKQVKQVVEEKTILGEFSKEQEKFVNDKKEKEGRQEAAVPPWVGYNEEQAMKEQILALSTDKRNFLRNPPAGVNFQFDFETAYPVAMATLAEDPNLEKMRFELVPKQLSEETFWRNYLYRVSLIKQSAQLSSLAQQTGSTGESSTEQVSSKPESSNTINNKDSATKRQSSKEDPMEMVNKSKRVSDREDDMVPGSSPPEHEFISDTFADSHIDEAALRKEMQQLGMDEKPQLATAEDDIPEWERELQAELQEYEVVDDGTTLDDADLENEILQQIEAESK